MLLDAATKLLDEFKKLPAHVERPQTFMEIAGYPRRENVCSNILKFFMDPEESHGLGTLMLDALVRAARIDVAEGSISSNVSVDRETVTQAGNRIDLLITSDDHAILIENKIDASSDNPFPEYAAYLDQIAEGREKHKILLTLSQNNAGCGWGFANLTYTDFVGEIRSLLGRYVSSADTRHLTI
nr:PD-(D/E)XK nuclease family protein [Rubrobacteraceae bacterium]